MKNQVKYLKDYTPSEFAVQSIYLTIDLRDDHALVTNEFSVSVVADASPKNIKLNGTNQELLGVEVDGKALTKNQYKLNSEELIIPVPNAQFTLKIMSKIQPSKNTALEGLYESDGLFLTQCEPFGFRSITYFLDRPDVMTVYTTKLIADEKYPVLLSNGDVIERGNLSGNRHFVTWYDTSKKPSYLFAAVFGDLEVKKDVFRTMSGKNVALEIFASKQDIDKVDYAMYSLKSAMRWDERVFGREYDLNTYMIVATHKFNFGAMENKGLNIFNTKYVLADKDVATDANYKNVHGVVGHEYFHNWTGNRITLRNWFQLSIKEGLTVFRDQEFSSDEFDRATERIKDADYIRSIQFKEDAGPLSHPVLPESYVAMNNFYTATVYDKGAEVVRMLHTILGSDMFRKAMDLYFDRHDGNAVVAEDFVKVMEDTSSMNLQQFSLWYSQAGTPIVEAQGQYDEVAKTYTLKCKQIYKHTEKQKNNKPFLIPIKIGFVGQHSGNVLNFNYLGASQNEVVLQLSQAEQTFMFNELQELPIPSLLRDFSAPVKMKFTYMDEQLVWLMVHDTNDFNRWNAGQTYMLNQVLEFMKVLKSGSEPRVPKALIDAFRAILQEKKLNREFITLTLMLPSDPVIYDQLHGIDPHLIFNAKKLMRTQLCTALKADLQTVYERLSSELQFRPYSLNKEDIAFRSLKNLCLSYLAVADIELATKLAQAQLASADNITDRIAALTVLVDLKDQSKAISDFYDQWKHEDLVVNKWLALQAASNRDDTVQLVSDLMQSDAFDIKVPNKIYSLLGAFQANSDKFHSADGSGYKLYADFIIKIDSMNPSVSAFLAKGFDNWKKFEINRRKLMTEALVKIRSQPNLSSNLREIIEMIS